MNFGYHFSGKGKAYLGALIEHIAKILLTFDKSHLNPCGIDGMPRSF
jgi:hypothetical protein